MNSATAVFQRARDAASSLMPQTNDDSADRGQIVAASSSEYVQGLSTSASSLVAEHGRVVVAKYSEYVQDLSDQLQEKKAMYIALLENMLKVQLQRQSESVIDRVPDVVRNKLVRPGTKAPPFVKRCKVRAFDFIWPDIREELVLQAALLIDAQSQTLYEQQIESRPGVDCFRAFLRHRLLPYNKSTWAMLRDPVYLIFMLGCCIPVAGVYAFVFTFLFFIIDIRDEYQLVQYILSFKGFQFFTHGVLRTIFGFWTYVACVTSPGDLAASTCVTDGPGCTGPYAVIMAAWFLQSVMVFVAAGFLVFSENKGRVRFTEDLEIVHTGSQIQGGYLAWALVYDGAIFVLCLAVLIAITATGPSTNDAADNVEAYDAWYKKHAAFCVQAVYGYLSFPFAVFRMPFLVGVLTHAAPTGYDELGRCRPYTGPPAPPKGIVYLPQSHGGVQVLTPTDKPGTWLVDSSRLKSDVDDLSYYVAKTKRDKADCEVPRWGDTVEGTEEGDWIACQRPPLVRYTISPQEAEILLNRLKDVLSGHLDSVRGSAGELLSSVSLRAVDVVPAGGILDSALGAAQSATQSVAQAAQEAVSTVVTSEAVQTVVSKVGSAVGVNSIQPDSTEDGDAEKRMAPGGIRV